MAALVHTTVENYSVLETGEALVDSWLFMKSPVPVVTILLLYLYFVLRLGPQLMEKRPAFNLKNVLIGYNAYQVIFSVWFCAQAFGVDNGFHILFKQCNSMPINETHAVALVSGAWWYFFSKVVELLDTVFFVLRKKQSQVTFLHVYHHSCMMFFSWAYLKYVPGEQGVVIGLLNSGVHAIMYFYYLLAAMGPQYQKYLWWKKYLTWLQLTQFCIMLMYLAFVIVMDCKMPKALTFFFVGNVVIFLYLFLDFYRNEYKKKKKIALDQEGESKKVN